MQKKKGAPKTLDTRRAETRKDSGRRRRVESKEVTWEARSCFKTVDVGPRAPQREGEQSRRATWGEGKKGRGGKAT